MAHPGGSQAVKIGVRLDGGPNSLGEWLADGTAFEAAGADTLWVDLGPEPELDPLALTAALAAVTFRSLLVTSVPARDGRSPALVRTLATIGKLSHGRLGIVADAPPPASFAELGPGLSVFRRIPGDPDAFEHRREPGDGERWVSAPPPDSRATWRATLLDAAERGSRGVLVPADLRLLDILRNPDDPGPRRDLQLAQG
jgi:hypothetical protein